MTYCVELLEELKFKVNTINSRNKPTFYLSNFKTKYLSHSPAKILMSAGYNVLHFDLFP
jgi:hypothetical protein